MYQQVPSAVIDRIKAVHEDDRVYVEIELFQPNDELKWRIDERGFRGPTWAVSIGGTGMNVRFLRGDGSGDSLRVAVIAALGDCVKDAVDGLAWKEQNGGSDASKSMYVNCARVARELLASVEAAWPEDAP